MLVINKFFQFHSGFHIVNAYEKGVRFRLGVFNTIEEPGLHFSIPIFDQVHILKTWEHSVPIPTQSVATKDLVTLSLDAVLRYHIVDPQAVVVSIDDADRAGTEIALAAIKEAVGEVSYEKLISERRDINEKIKEVVDSKVEPWGLRILGVEIKKSIPVDQNVQEALAKRAISEQERLSRTIIADAELAVAKILVSAAKVFGEDNGISMQLRYYQSLEKFAEIESGNFLFPVPLASPNDHKHASGIAGLFGFLEEEEGNDDPDEEN